MAFGYHDGSLQPVPAQRTQNLAAQLGGGQAARSMFGFRRVGETRRCK